MKRYVIIEEPFALDVAASPPTNGQSHQCQSTPFLHGGAILAGVRLVQAIRPQSPPHHCSAQVWAVRHAVQSIRFAVLSIASLFASRPRPVTGAWHLTRKGYGNVE